MNIAYRQGHLSAKNTQDLVEISYFGSKLKDTVEVVLDAF